MYVGNRGLWGLHQLFRELLDNTIDQFLAGKCTTVRVSLHGDQLKFYDDGPGLPFEIPHKSGEPLATHYLKSWVRLSQPIAYRNTPHFHVGGLFVVAGLTRTCQIDSWRHGKLWRQSFTSGREDGRAEVVEAPENIGTTYRITIEREVFDADWRIDMIEQQLQTAAYLFPGLRVQTPTMNFVAGRGLADWAATLTPSREPMWWINQRFGDLHIQAAILGRRAKATHWRTFANGNQTLENGAHLTAFKRALSYCKLKPAVGMIHVIMENPRFAGPTRSRLHAPELFSPIYQALKPELQRFSESA